LKKAGPKYWDASVKRTPEGKTCEKGRAKSTTKGIKNGMRSLKISRGWGRGNLERGDLIWDRTKKSKK